MGSSTTPHISYHESRSSEVIRGHWPRMSFDDPLRLMLCTDYPPIETIISKLGRIYLIHKIFEDWSEYIMHTPGPVYVVYVRFAPRQSAYALAYAHFLNYLDVLTTCGRITWIIYNILLTSGLVFWLNFVPSEEKTHHRVKRYWGKVTYLKRLLYENFTPSLFQLLIFWKSGMKHKEKCNWRQCK